MGLPLGPGGEDITWPDQVAPRGQKASSTRKIKPQTSNPIHPQKNGCPLDRGHVGTMPGALGIAHGASSQ